MIGKSFQLRNYSKLLASVVAVILGMLVGLIVLMVTHPESGWDGFVTLLLGSQPYGGIKAVGNILYYATPIMLTGLGVAFSFQAGVFNIGGPGQFIIGAFAAVYTAIKWTFLPDFLRWIVPCLCALLAGALWAFIPGLIKAYFNVNVVISTIMMNYIGMYVVNYLTRLLIFDSTKGQSQSIPGAAQLPKIGLDKLFPGSSVHIGFVIAVFVAVVVHFLLNSTVFGYEIKACGMNPDACKYAGVKEKRNTISAIMISGGIIGLAGALLYLAATGKHIIVVDKLAVEGFNGIAVALLASSSPLGVIISAIFVGYITVGGQYMQRFGFVPEIVDIIIAVIIYFAAFVFLIQGYIEKFLLNLERKEAKE